MRLSELQVGEMCTRTEYATKGLHGQPLIIEKTEAGALMYRASGDVRAIPVQPDSKSAGFNDYFLCDEHGSPVSTSGHGAFDTAAFCVIELGKGPQLCNNIREVEMFVEDIYKIRPNTKFRVFQLVAKIEPRPFNLADCIQVVNLETAE